MSVSGHHGEYQGSGFTGPCRAEAVSCDRTDGCLCWRQIQPMKYTVSSEMDIKRCNSELCRHYNGGKSGCEQDSLQCSLCYSSRQVNQANPLFSCKTWKLAFNQWDVKGVLAANRKAGNTMLFWLWTSSEAISALCLCCAAVLLMSPARPLSQPALHKQAAQETYCTSLTVSAKYQRPGREQRSIQRKWIHTNSVAGGSLYCSAPSNSNLSDCSAVSCNHHTHTQRKRERTGITHWVANYRV